MVIAALAGGASVPRAAEQTGVSERTIWRRLDDPAFVTQLTEARRRVVASAIDSLSAATTAAVGTLIRLMGQDQPPSVRLRAAVAVLEAHHKYRMSQELEQRLAALETTLEQQAPQRQPWGR